jgi:high-affinity Fe2+/Pb2+ permease
VRKGTSVAVIITVGNFFIVRFRSGNLIKHFFKLSAIFTFYFLQTYYGRNLRVSVIC